MFTLICGLPNAGKTTYSLRYPKAIHMDEVRQRRKAVEMVKSADDICIEGVFPFSDSRKEFVEAYIHGGRKICVWLDTPFDECIKRENRNRSHIIIENCREYFEPPTLDEGWDEIIIIRGEHEQCINRQREN